MTMLAAPPVKPAAQPIVTPPAIPTTVEYGSRRTLIVLGVMLASLLGRIDGTIVNVALPTIQGNLGASFDEATWIIIGYLMANVVVIPLTPWLATRFGRRETFVAAIVGFTVLSLLCATATSIQELIFLRILQGAFAGGIDSTANTVITSTFPPSKMGLAQSIFTVSASAAPPIGLILGGVLTDNLSWQWCFLINVPLGTAAAILLIAMLRNPPTGALNTRPRIDAIGVALLAIGPSLLVYVLSEGDRYDWFNDANLVLTCVIGVLATTAFVVWELRGTSTPIVDLRIFKFRRVAIGALLAVGNAFVYLSTMVFLPQYAQEVLGYTPTQSGLLVLVRALVTTFCIPIAGALASRVDVRWLIGGGFIGMSLGSYWQSQVMTPGTDFAALIGPLVVAGIGNSFTFSPLFVAIIGGVPHTERPKAAAITSVTIQLGGALATAVLISTLHIRTVFHQTILASNVTLSHIGVADFVHRFGLAALNTLIEDQARAFSYSDVAILISLVAIASAPFVFFLGRPHHA
jgi:MFS transporter, DHA2 family, multidrug resistance protein